MSRVLVYRALKCVLALLPIRWSIGLAKVFFKVGYWIDLKKRNNVIENLSIVCGTHDVQNKAKEVFSSFGRYLVEFLSPISKREFLRKSTEVIGLENALSVYRKGKGVIGLTAHIGNWEMGAYMTAQLGMEVSAVYITHSNPGVDSLFMQQRLAPGLTVIPWKQDPTRRCLQVLKKGEFLAIAGDIDFSGTGVEVELFGKKTKIPRGPIVFSQRTGASIVPAVYVWTSSGRQLIYYKAIEPEHYLEEELADQIAMSLEDMIRNYPTQWICFEKIFQ